jgi:hypothetical protein
MERAEKEAEKEREKEKSTSTRRTTTSRRSTRMNPVVKVLTSATFIRGVMGVLKKVMR